MGNIGHGLSIGFFGCFGVLLFALVLLGACVLSTGVIKVGLS